MTPDPKGIVAANRFSPQSLNRYAYTDHNPVNRVDQAGTDWIAVGGTCTRVGFIIGALIYYTGWDCAVKFVWIPEPPRPNIFVNVQPYQLPVPHVVGPYIGSPPKSDPPISLEQRTLNATFVRAKDRIKSKTDCAKLFEGFDLDDYMSKHISISDKLPDGTAFPSAITHAVTTNKGPNGTILDHLVTVFNINSPIFTGGAPRADGSWRDWDEYFAQGGQMSPALSKISSLDDFRDEDFLHELFHASHPTREWDDYGSRVVRDKIDKLINDNCF